ncbi:hypothetical protein RB614_12555 [Phytohabitans sp. ZYX-F-186]|uniref:Uncharacterized protein n=1 Tax=Phytohabitans maris TaxID=3071409 RepID=A0ABU0ZE69_9ACTN|nr:hypothetical protein [Phytohabitans sp. ZYX-F-186]MDQ7905356.1 hypothetical protein [Phytohabitans sp. ZYX-F-186]
MAGLRPTCARRLVRLCPTFASRPARTCGAIATPRWVACLCGAPATHWMAHSGRTTAGRTAHLRGAAAHWVARPGRATAGWMGCLCGAAARRAARSCPPASVRWSIGTGCATRARIGRVPARRVAKPRPAASTHGTAWSRSTPTARRMARLPGAGPARWLARSGPARWLARLGSATLARWMARSALARTVGRMARYRWSALRWSTCS